jgi:hypothetical protein
MARCATFRQVGRVCQSIDSRDAGDGGIRHIVPGHRDLQNRRSQPANRTRQHRQIFVRGQDGNRA